MFSDREVFPASVGDGLVSEVWGWVSFIRERKRQRTEGGGGRMRAKIKRRTGIVMQFNSTTFRFPLLLHPHVMAM